MPTITTVDATWDTGVTMDASELRRADTAMFLGDGSNNGVRGGVVYHGPTSLGVTVNGSDQVTVQAGAFVIPAATGLGVYRGALQSATAAVGVAPRNATNPRIDLIVIQATGTNATVRTIDGTPGAAPAAPALPAQHIEIARVTVPAVGGGAVTVDSSWRAYATSLGGTLFVATLARLPGSGSILGQKAVALDTGVEHRWNGTAWIVEIATGTPSLSAGIAGASVATVVRRGYFGKLIFDLTTTAGLVAPQELMVLPNGFRPVIDDRAVAVNYTTTVPVLVTVKANGQVVTENNVTSGHRLLGSATFPVS